MCQSINWRLCRRTPPDIRLNVTICKENDEIKTSNSNKKQNIETDESIINRQLIIFFEKVTLDEKLLFFKRATTSRVPRSDGALLHFRLPRRHTRPDQSHPTHSFSMHSIFLLPRRRYVWVWCKTVRAGEKLFTPGCGTATPGLKTSTL